jgi:hypothetical protein
MKCEETHCMYEATHITHWPMRMIYHCEFHNKKAVIIGDALGVQVRTEKLDESQGTTRTAE